jgi:16S rRNA (uracil1498-N3)-methyltransferase
VTLADDEAAHLIRVLRLRPGEVVRAFDGHGREFEAIVDHAARRVARLRIGDAIQAAPERRVRVTLAQAVLKTDKMDDVIRDATMLGVAAIHPILTARAEATSTTATRRRDRWERVAVSSTKQCGRAVIPALLAPCTFEELITAGVMRSPRAAAFMFVEPGAANGALSLQDVAAEAPDTATVIVGPEGGWTQDEVAIGRRTCQLVTLRGPTLRADAMPIVALSALFARWSEW